MPGDKDFCYMKLTRGLPVDVMVIYNMIPKLTCITVSETTPKDHLMIWREFYAGNNAHTMSSSLRV